MAKALPSIRPYFRERIQTVDPKFEEHEDGFNIDNVGSNELEQAFHIGFGPATGRPINQNCLSALVPVTLTFWVPGYRNELEAVDNGLERIEAVIQECLRHSKRLNQPFIKDVQLTGFSVEPIAQSNDNVTKATLNFSCLVHIDIQT